MTIIIIYIDTVTVQLMCDEAEQRQLRQSALEQKLEGIKQDQGRLFSGNFCLTLTFFKNFLLYLQLNFLITWKTVWTVLTMKYIVKEPRRCTVTSHCQQNYLVWTWVNWGLSVCLIAVSLVQIISLTKSKKWIMLGQQYLSSSYDSMIVFFSLISHISDDYQFSTLWGMYIHGSANHIEVQK